MGARVPVMSRPSKAGPTVPFQLRVNPKQLAEWRKLADAERRTLSDWIRCALDDLVASRKKDRKSA